MSFGWLHNQTQLAADLLQLKLPKPDDRPPLTPSRYVASVLPVLGLQYLMAVLVLMPGTRIYRLALLPLVLYLAFRAATTLDYSARIPDMNHWNYGGGVFMFVVGLRSIEWCKYYLPLKKRYSPGDKRHSVFWDAADLMSNMRGIGWEWSKALHIPPEDRPTNSRRAFVLGTLLRFIRNVFVFDAFQYTIQAMSPETFGSPTGGTIFDPRLPPVIRYFRSTFITALSGTTIYFSLTMGYYLATLIAFVIPGVNHDPAYWPPFSEGPWKATSLEDYWGKKWHQSFRQPFIQVAGRPMRRVFGRAGGVLGIFIISGMLHDWCIWGMGRGTDFPQLGGFFVLNGVGVILERTWERITAKKVSGLAGWLWTMTWVLCTANLLVDAWLSRGLAGCRLLPDPVRPVKFIIRKLNLHYE